jgi:hypothetical protein
MQRVLALVAVAGCASGSSSVTHDAAIADAEKTIDAAIDAPRIDSPMIDGPLIDAPIDAMIDAPMIDAMIDAPMIDAPPDACVPINAELLVNPALDLAPAGTGWQQTVIDPAFPLITGDGTLNEHSAPYKAWLGGIVSDGFPGTVTDVLYQDVVVPANTTQLVLTAYYDVRSGEDPAETTVFDSAAIDVTQPNGTPIVTVRSLSNLTPTTAWTMVTHTFAPNLAGQTIRVRMTSSNDFFRATSFYFDTLSLRALHCP